MTRTFEKQEHVIAESRVLSFRHDEPAAHYAAQSQVTVEIKVRAASSVGWF